MLQDMRTALEGADLHNHAAIAHRFAVAVAQMGDDIDAPPLHAALTHQERQAPHGQDGPLAAGMRVIEQLWAQTCSKIETLPRDF